MNASVVCGSSSVSRAPSARPIATASCSSASAELADRRLAEELGAPQRQRRERVADDVAEELAPGGGPEVGVELGMERRALQQRRELRGPGRSASVIRSPERWISRPGAVRSTAVLAIAGISRGCSMCASCSTPFWITTTASGARRSSHGCACALSWPFRATTAKSMAASPAGGTSRSRGSCVALDRQALRSACACTTSRA